MAGTLRMTCGMDIGNGYVKARIACEGQQPRNIDLPSSVTYVSPSAPWLPRSLTSEYVDDLANELDCTISSQAINQSDRGRIIVGRRSVDSGDTQVLFNIDDHVPKCEDSLSYELALSTIAAEALRIAIGINGQVPADVINVECAMGVALPVSDYMDYRSIYKARFEQGEHRVTIHNFEQEAVVAIRFKTVVVLAEGAAAQYAIGELGAPFLAAALEECRMSNVQIPIERGDGTVETVSYASTIDDEESGSTLVSYGDTIGVDIGEGTVNFPVFRNGDVSVETSSSINSGYGTVLSKVVAATRNEPFAPSTRKALSEFMLEQNLAPAKRRIRNKLQRLIDSEASVFARDVVAEYKHVLGRTKLSANATYVYGGGATAVRDMLLPELVKASRLDDDVYIPVIYLDSAYSRDLNRNGLFLVAQLAVQAMQ